MAMQWPLVTCDIGSYSSIFNSSFQASYQTCFHEDYQQKLFVLCFETIFKNTLKKLNIFFLIFILWGPYLKTSLCNNFCKVFSVFKNKKSFFEKS